MNTWYQFKMERKKKRSLHEAVPRKVRKEPNITAKRNSKNTKEVVRKNQRWSLLDKVKLNDKIGTITGFTGSTAYIRDSKGNYTQDSPNYKQVSLDKLKLVCKNNNWVYQEVTL